MFSYAVELVLQPGEQLAPAAARVGLRVHGAHGGRRAAHDAHQQLDARVRALLVVPARPRRRLQQPRPLVRHALDDVMYPVLLPAVLHEQQRSERVGVAAQLVAVRVRHLPQQLGQRDPRPARVLPAHEL